jgi:hypothetical protein
VRVELRFESEIHTHKIKITMTNMTSIQLKTHISKLLERGDEII